MINIDYSIQKLNAALDCISDLQSCDFPHDDPKNALGALAQVLEKDLENLQNLDTNTSEEVVRSHCINAITDVSDVLEAAGLIKNSLSIRNGAILLRCGYAPKSLAASGRAA